MGHERKRMAGQPCLKCKFKKMVLSDFLPDENGETFSANELKHPNQFFNSFILRKNVYQIFKKILIYSFASRDKEDKN